jgi:hypothetical protein
MRERDVVALVVVLLCLVFFGGCGGSGSSPPAVTVVEAVTVPGPSVAETVTEFETVTETVFVPEELPRTG